MASCVSYSEAKISRVSVTTDICTIDFETFSVLNVKDVGAWRYAEHESTEILCMGWAIGEMDPKIWIPGQPFPWEVLEHIKAGKRFEAHNAQFERAIWKHVLLGELGIPMPTKWQDTQAVCAYRGLPLALDEVGEVLNLPIQKDKRGKYLLQLLSQPRKMLAGEKKAWVKLHGDKPLPMMRRTAASHPDLFQELCEYCITDVRSERSLSQTLGPLPPAEQKLWVLDQIINQRGVQVDLEAVEAAIKVVEVLEGHLEKELQAITNGAVETGGQTAKIVKWLNDEGGIEMDNLQKDTVENMLLEFEDVKTPGTRVLEIRQLLSRASTKKLYKILETVCADGKLRGLLQYHGAGTGRWCLTGDHEVLTKRHGWQRLDQWTGGDIACWSQTEAVSFQKAISQRFDFEGSLYHHKDSRVDQIATAEHKMPGWSSHTGQFQIKEVATLGRFCVPYTGSFLADRHIDENALRVLIMVQADGHYTTDGSIRLHFSKTRKIERCKMILRRAEIIYSVKQEKDRTTTFRIARRHLPLNLLMFANKTFGWWLLNCDSNVFFNELEHWDAYRAGPNSLQYVTTNKLNAEIVQTLAHVSGRAALITEKKDRSDKWADTYYVSIWLTPSNRHEIRKHSKTIIPDQSGYVYCPKTSSGFFLVRRNGKIWVTGNSGRLAQLQNLPRGDKNVLKLGIEALINIVKEIDAEILTLCYGNPMEAISSSLRGMFIATLEHILRVVDFSAIECRVVMWVAGQEDALEAFRAYDRKEGPDIYCVMAQHLYNKPINKVDHPKERGLGKITVLGAGYQMGPDKLQFQALKQDKVKIDDATAAFLINGYRTTYEKVKYLWYGLEEAAIEAVNCPGQVVRYSKIAYQIVNDKAGRWLTCILPNGRRIWYYQPEINEVVVTYKDGTRHKKDQLGYWGRDNKRGGQWGYVTTYGGMLTENSIQAISRDLMVEAMIRVEAAGYPVILTVHDEIISETLKDKGDQKEFENLMRQVPAWAEGCPIDVEGWCGTRYRKG